MQVPEISFGNEVSCGAMENILRFTPAAKALSR
jgi:hypothetical protein